MRDLEKLTEPDLEFADRECQFRELVENARDIIYTHDLQGRFVAVNKAASDITGYPNDELMGMRISDVVAPEYLPAIEERFMHKLLNHDQTRYEIEIITGRGNRVCLEVNSRLVLTDGHPVGVQGIARDITDRRRMETERQALSEIIQSASTSTNLDDLLKSIHQAIGRVLYAENCFVALCNDGDTTLKMQFFADKYDSPPADQQLGMSCTSYVLRTGDAALIPQDEFERLVDAGEVEVLGAPSPSWLGVPLKTPVRTIGVLVVQDYENADAYSEQDLEFLSSVAGPIAFAIERKRAEEALRESEEELRDFFENANDLIQSVDPEGRFVFVNRAWRETLGYSDEEIQRLTIFDVLAPECLSHCRETFARVIAGETIPQFEVVFQKRDGSRVVVEGHVNCRFKDGKPVATRGIFRDVTERKAAEHELQTSEERYRELVENADDIIYSHDFKGRYTAVNRAVERVTKYTPEEALKLTFGQSIAPDSLPKVKEMMGSLLAGNEIVATELEIIAKDNRLVPVEVKARLAVKDGVPVGVNGVARDITDRKSAAERLHASEERFRNLVETTSDWIWEVDASAVYTYVSPRVYQLLGYQPEELIGKRPFDLMPPEEAERVGAQFESIAAKREPFHGLVNINRHKNGHLVTLETSGNPVFDECGSFQGYRGVDRDITDRKRTEAELRFQKSMLESQAEASIDGILVVSPERKILSYNRRFIELWKLPNEMPPSVIDKEVLKLVLNQLIEPDEFLARVEYLYEHPEEKSREEIKLKDGRTLDRFSAPVLGPAGERYGRVWFFRDVTEKKFAQAELHRLAAAVEQTADSIVITDTTGNIEYVNPAFERNTGYERAEALGKNPRILKSGKTDSDVYADLWRTITSGEVWAGQLTNKKKDGSLLEERVTISPVRDSSGEIVNYIAVKQDITNQIHLEQQVRQSQRLEAIGQLAGGVAHDFNNLLTAILGYSDLTLAKLDPNDRMAHNIEEIKKAGQRAAALTRQLLAFSRKQILEPQVLDLNSVINDINKMLRRLIGEDIALITKCAANLGTVKADLTQIEQVIMNLVVNARDAMPQGGKLIIETRNVTLDADYSINHEAVERGEYVMLAVTDTGCGMDAETQARIFEPFFTTKGLGKGTGLGLSTLYGIVKQSGGYVWVYSEMKQGTTFKVYLPRIDQAVSSADKQSRPEQIEKGSGTLLLVEDDPAVRGVTARFLEAAGYTVLQAESGQRALEIVKHVEDIRLVVTDVVMPEMSGRELSEHLASLLPEARVLFVSGYTDDAIVRAGIVGKNVAFLEKPFTPQSLARKVREVLGDG